MKGPSVQLELLAHTSTTHPFIKPIKSAEKPIILVPKEKS